MSSTLEPAQKPTPDNRGHQVLARTLRGPLRQSTSGPSIVALPLATRRSKALLHRALAQKDSAPMTPSPQDHTTIIGPGAHIKGEMTFEHGVRIEGGFEGRIVAGGEVSIAEGAACKASITASSVRIDGDVEGEITAQEVVHLGAKASMTGDITAVRLLVTDGASFLGHCRIGPDAVSGNLVPRTVTPPARPAQPPEPQVRPRGADIETRPVEVARARLAEAQVKLARMSAVNKSAHDPAAA